LQKIPEESSIAVDSRSSNELNEALSLTRLGIFRTPLRNNERPGDLLPPLPSVAASSVTASSLSKKQSHEYACTDHGLVFTSEDQTV
jgi:hypothetical protein